MGLLNWIESKWTKNIENIFSRQCKTVLNTTANNIIYNERKKLHYSKEIENKINNEFLDHDGYFTKLMIDNKVIGYIFRCTYKDIELVTKTGKKRLIPYLVTCVYQPAYNGVKTNYIKTLGKDRALKSGVRELKEYIDVSNDLDLLGLNKEMEFDNVFPSYNMLNFTENVCTEFAATMTVDEYNNMKSYIKTFDEKTFKYYSSVSKNDIVKIWIKK